MQVKPRSLPFIKWNTHTKAGFFITEHPDPHMIDSTGKDARIKIFCEYLCNKGRA